MRIQDIIAAKRDGIALSSEDIHEIVLGYSSGEVPDYQMSAFLMAAYINGLDFAETSALTRAMVDSGAMLDLSAVDGIKVDKHSTGGVGDKATLVLVPMIAACGLKAPKMSGRGLGFTGGTLDKLESIPGFNTALSMDRFVKQVNEIGAAMAGQTQDIVPADKKIYALRDVTATVDCISLISASIMSKKIACSSDVILLDVKVGSGAFVGDIRKARKLAQTMIAIGKSFDRKVCAAITDMNQPLGFAVGNSLEVREAIETLKGKGPSDLRALCVELCAIILDIVGLADSPQAAHNRAEQALDSGKALEVFRCIIEAQDGNPKVIDNPEMLPTAKITHEVRAVDNGYVAEIAVNRIGIAASVLGAGRERKEDSIDPAVGIIINKKLGDEVEKGDLLATMYANNPGNVQSAERYIIDAYKIGQRVDLLPLIYEVVT